MKVDIYQLDKRDTQSFSRLLDVFAEVFEMESFVPPTEEYLSTMLSNETFFAFVASADEKVVGGVTCYVLNQYYKPSSYVYIFDLAVHPRYQRMGFGSRLIQAVIEHGKSLGADEVFVQADDVDVHALEFYRSTQGQPEKVTHFTYSLK